VETQPYDNAETWFTRVRAILDGKEIWIPIQDICSIRQGLDLQTDADEDDNFFLSPHTLLPSITRTSAPVSTREASTETDNMTEAETIRKL
jgi:hypothetical protein